jgi:hypothetical protein
MSHGNNYMISGYECSLCGLYDQFPDIWHLYDTPYQFHVIERLCWCWNCQKVEKAEYIPSQHEILEEAKAWQRQDMNWTYQVVTKPFFDKDFEKLHDDVMIHLDHLLEWRRQRKSAGRCLGCGDTRISLTSEHALFEHPFCGGMIHWLMRIGGSTCYLSPPKRVYSTEGLYLRDEPPHSFSKFHSGIE